MRQCDSILKNYSLFKGKSILLDESISYYMGLGEAAIYWLKDMPFPPFSLGIQEKELSNYFMDLFWNHSYREKNSFYNPLKESQEICYELVIAHMLYPDYYFSLVEDIMNDRCDSSVLKQVIARASEYEEYLSYFLNTIKSFYPIKKNLPF